MREEAGGNRYPSLTTLLLCRREWMAQSCPLISTYVPWQVYTHIHVHKIANKYALKIIDLIHGVHFGFDTPDFVVMKHCMTISSSEILFDGI